MSPRNAAAGWLAACLVVAGLIFSLTACKTTKDAPVEDNSGFLGDYSRLESTTNDESRLVYFNESADWAKYTKAYIAPVELWDSGDSNSDLSKLDDEDKHLIINYAYTALWTNLSRDYQIVDESAAKSAGVLVVRAAITEAEPSKPVPNFVGTLISVSLAVSYSKRTIFDPHLAMGKCQTELELLDGPTGTRLAAAVDRRAGTKELKTKFDGSFGDVKLALDYSAQRLQTRLAEERVGATARTDL